MSASEALHGLQQLIEVLSSRRAYDRLYWYRVVEMDGPRVHLQAMVKSAGLPDAPHVQVLPGVAGCAATLKPGSEVLLGFIDQGDGNPVQPVLLHAAAADGVGFVPIDVTFDAEHTINIGASSDTVSIGPPATAVPLAKHDVLAEMLSLIEQWAVFVDLAVGPILNAQPPPTPADYTAIVTQRQAYMANLDNLMKTIILRGQ